MIIQLMKKEALVMEMSHVKAMDPPAARNDQQEQHKKTNLKDKASSKRTGKLNICQQHRARCSDCKGPVWAAFTVDSSKDMRDELLVGHCTQDAR